MRLSTRNQRWNHGRFTERVLAESALQVIPLSEMRRARVLAALFAETARLRAASCFRNWLGHSPLHAGTK